MYHRFAKVLWRGKLGWCYRMRCQSITQSRTASEGSLKPKSQWPDAEGGTAARISKAHASPSWHVPRRPMPSIRVGITTLIFCVPKIDRAKPNFLVSFFVLSLTIDPNRTSTEKKTKKFGLGKPVVNLTLVLGTHRGDRRRPNGIHSFPFSVGGNFIYLDTFEGLGFRV
jgi:hypothetical protein